MYCKCNETQLIILYVNLGAFESINLFKLSWRHDNMTVWSINDVSFFFFCYNKMSNKFTTNNTEEQLSRE